MKFKNNKVIGTRGQGVRVWCPRELTTEHLTKPSLRLDQPLCSLLGLRPIPFLTTVKIDFPQVAPMLRNFFPMSRNLSLKRYTLLKLPTSASKWNKIASNRLIWLIFSGNVPIKQNQLLAEFYCLWTEIVLFAKQLLFFIWTSLIQRILFPFPSELVS